MTRRQLFDRTVAQLSELYPEREARAMAQVLFEEYLGLRRQDVFLYPDEPADGTGKLECAVKELLTGRPLQYVTGKAWFADMEFDVTESVLIPRPETEELMRWIASESREGGSLRVLDIGTGSGCIAVSLAVMLPGAEVHAVDISAAALVVAESNAAKHGAKVRFSKLDILAETPLGRFDAIVSNPPYVLRSEKAAMRANVLDFEPALALFVDDGDPLLFYRRIAEVAREVLNMGGRLYFEINEAFGAETAAMLSSLNFSDIELRKDIFDRDRMVKAVWK